jgi:hypothetical protein
MGLKPVPWLGGFAEELFGLGNLIRKYQYAPAPMATRITMTIMAVMVFLVIDIIAA